MQASGQLPPSYHAAQSDRAPLVLPDPPPAYSEAEANKWWADLPEEKQAALQRRCANKHPAQRKLYIRQLRQQRIYIQNHLAYSSPSNLDLSDLLILDFLLSNRRNFFFAPFGLIDRSIDALIVGSAISGGNCGGCGKCDGEAATIAAAVIALILALASAIIFGAYAIKKALNSFYNLFHGDKIGKSLLRIGLIGGGAYLGVSQGLIVGALIGSLVPGIGTAAGAIIGAICGALITAGMGALIAKYTGKFASWLFSKEDDISTTNHEKYRPAQEKLAAELADENGQSDKDTATYLLSILRAQKNREWTFPGTSDRAEKEKYNALLRSIAKDNAVDNNNGTLSYRISNGTLFSWNNDNGSWGQEAAVRMDRIGLSLDN